MLRQAQHERLPHASTAVFRVIDIDSRRFATVEKALVELITNSDDSYASLEKPGKQVTGHILIKYERHQTGAVLVVADQAERSPSNGSVLF